MVMWGLNKNSRDNLNKTANKDVLNTNEIEEGLVETTSPSINNTSSEDNYIDIINQLEPDSRINMINKSISLGIPTSFVVGYFDVKEEDRKDLLGRGLKKGCEKVINKHVFTTQLKDKVLVVSEDDNIIQVLIEIEGSKEYVLIKDLDNLISAMENDITEITVLFNSVLPQDIEDNIDILVSHLESVDGIFFIEVGKGKYFKNSLSVDNLTDLIGKDIIEKDIEIEEVKENIIKANVKNINDDFSKVDEEVKVKVEKEVKAEVKAEIKAEPEADKTNYKKLYAEMLNELEDTKQSLEKCKNELKIKESKLIEAQLSITNNLNVSQDTVEIINDKNIEIKTLQSMILELEEDIKTTRLKYSRYEIDIEAQKELLRDRNEEIKGLKNSLEELEDKVKEIEDEHLNVLKNMVDISVVEELNNTIDNKNIENSNLNSQIKTLRVEVRKEVEDKHLLKEELEKINKSYKDIISNNKTSSSDIEEIFFGGDLETQIFYFKMITQPPYFKSFMENLVEILSENKKVLTIVLREEDELSDLYFSDFRKINLLEEVSSSDKNVWVKPSKMMLVKDASFYNQYDSVVVIDYLKNKNRYLKGDYVTPIHVFMSEKERDVLGVKGMILSGGESSIVDLRYDKKFELAKTAFIRKKYIKRKVTDWMQNYGLN